MSSLLILESNSMLCITLIFQANISIFETSSIVFHQKFFEPQFSPTLHSGLNEGQKENISFLLVLNLYK